MAWPLSRNARKTGAVSAAPPEVRTSSLAVWRRASAPFALSRNARKTGAVSAAPPEVRTSSLAVWRRASAPFALSRNARKTGAVSSSHRKGCGVLLFSRWRASAPFALLCFLLSIVAASAAESGYLGSTVCAGCHTDIAATQAKTRMAQTWQGTTFSALPRPYSSAQREGPEPRIEYKAQRQGDSIQYSVTAPGLGDFSAPVSVAVGGSRHGVSFMVRVERIGNLPIERPALVQTRFQHSALTHGLALSPGLSAEKPADLETALGLVLSPQFETNCLTCHGEPLAPNTHETGVQCESCHGPGAGHLKVVGTAGGVKSQDLGILNPKKLTPTGKMAMCESCHRGFSPMSDPTPDDLLISNQTNALRNSECWRQSGGNFSCVNCHNPHNDRTREQVVADSVRTCLECHAASVQPHAAICPVNRVSGCTECHMPQRAKAWFQKSDHWIRVYPGGKSYKLEEAWKSQVTPRRLYLRIIATSDAEKAQEASAKLAAGESFFNVATQYSNDETAPGGGFLGDLAKEDLSPAWAASALRLDRGETSGVINGAGHYYILQRVERNFKIAAANHFDKAMQLRALGKKAEAKNELLASLRIDPRFIRALTWLGVTFAEEGNSDRAIGVLRFAAQVDPADPGAMFNLAVALEASGHMAEAESAYRKAKELEPDLVPVYLNLGGLLLNQEKVKEARDIFKQGLQMNPLSASLYYNLAQLEQKAGRREEAEAARKLSIRLDPRMKNQ